MTRLQSRPFRKWTDRTVTRKEPRPGWPLESYELAHIKTAFPRRMFFRKNRAWVLSRLQLIDTVEQVPISQKRVRALECSRGRGGNSAQMAANEQAPDCGSFLRDHAQVSETTPHNSCERET